MILIIAVAVFGYLLMTVPGRMVEQYHSWNALGDGWGYAFVGVVGLGLLMFLGAIGYLVALIVRDTRRSKVAKQEQAKPIGQMSSKQKKEAYRR